MSRETSAGKHGMQARKKTHIMGNKAGVGGVGKLVAGDNRGKHPFGDPN